MKITAETSLLEIAVLVSEALEKAGIPAVPGGGGAVTHYSDNEYMSTDLDFITVERNKVIAPIVAALGLRPRERTSITRIRDSSSSSTGSSFVRQPIRRFFPSRHIENAVWVAANNYGNTMRDGSTGVVRSWQRPSGSSPSVLVARHQPVDWRDISDWAAAEGIDKDVIAGIRAEATPPAT